MKFHRMYPHVTIYLIVSPSGDYFSRHFFLQKSFRMSLHIQLLLSPYKLKQTWCLNSEQFMDFPASPRFLESNLVSKNALCWEEVRFVVKLCKLWKIYQIEIIKMMKNSIFYTRELKAGQISTLSTTRNNLSSHDLGSPLDTIQSCSHQPLYFQSFSRVSQCENQGDN